MPNEKPYNTIECFAAPLLIKNENNDPVNHPSHYTSGDVECIDAIRASMSHEAYCGYLKGNIMKYLWRYGQKGKPVEDLEKAHWYLVHLMEEVKNEPK